jgi:hypothetical protein
MFRNILVAIDGSPDSDAALSLSLSLVISFYLFSRCFLSGIQAILLGLQSFVLSYSNCSTCTGFSLDDRGCA